MPDAGGSWPSRCTDLDAAWRGWRAAHPAATLTEIEAAVDAQLQAVRAAMVTELAAHDPPPGCCPSGGEALVRRGTQRRTVRLPGEHALTLDRAYATCPACGHGLFPPR